MPKSANSPAVTVEADNWLDDTLGLYVFGNGVMPAVTGSGASYNDASCQAHSNSGDTFEAKYECELVAGNTNCTSCTPRTWVARRSGAGGKHNDATHRRLLWPCAR